MCSSDLSIIADELWGPGTGERRAGKGKVYANLRVDEALTLAEVAPDFEYSKPQTDTNLLFVHRKLPDGEVYWVNNRAKRNENLDATFRVAGKAAEIWHPDTGRTEPASFKIAGGRTTVTLRLEPADAVFVVFRKAAAAPSRTLPAPVETALATVEGAWEVSFQAERGAPAKITLPQLTSWHENADRKSVV